MNCTQGQLAIVKRNVLPENIDLIVVCVRLLEETTYCGARGFQFDDRWFFPGDQYAGPVWLVETKGSDIVTQDLATGVRSTTRMAPMADCDLWPIRPLDPSETINTDEELTV